MRSAIGSSRRKRDGWRRSLPPVRRAVAESPAPRGALWELRPNSRGAIDVTVPVGSGRARARNPRCTAPALPPTRLSHPPRYPGHHALPCDLRPGGQAAPSPHGASDLRTRAPAPSRPGLTPRALDPSPSEPGFEVDPPDPRRLRAHPYPRGVRVPLSRLPRHQRSPTPDVQRAARPRSGRQITPDCLWRSHRLIVELDGRDAHARRLAFETDRARDRALAVAGYRVIRITWRQLRDEAHAVAADLSTLLFGTVWTDA